MPARASTNTQYWLKHDRRPYNTYIIIYYIPYFLYYYTPLFFSRNYRSHRKSFRRFISSSTHSSNSMSKMTVIRNSYVELCAPAHSTALIYEIHSNDLTWAEQNTIKPKFIAEFGGHFSWNQIWQVSINEILLWALIVAYWALI